MVTHDLLFADVALVYRQGAPDGAGVLLVRTAAGQWRDQRGQIFAKIRDAYGHPDLAGAELASC